MQIFGRSNKATEISTETIIKAILLTIGAILLLNFLAAIIPQLTLIAVAAFLAIGLNPSVGWFAKKFRIKSRAKATAVAYLAVISFLVAIMTFVVPTFVRQTTEFVREVPTIIQNFQEQDSALSNLVSRYNLNEQLDRFREDLGSKTGDLADPILATAGRAVGTFVSMITVLVLTFMMLIEGPVWFNRFLALQPRSKREQRRRLAERMYKVITGYVNGQVLIAAISAVFALIALLIGNVIFDTSVNAVALAGITFIFGLIPMVGTIIGATIVVLMCLFESPSLAIMIAIYYIVYQQIENLTLQPHIQSRGNQLTPLIVFVAALIGAGYGGLLGALVAIPAAGCLKILAEEWLDKRLPSHETIQKS